MLSTNLLKIIISIVRASRIQPNAIIMLAAVNFDLICDFLKLYMEDN